MCRRPINVKIKIIKKNKTFILFFLLRAFKADLFFFSFALNPSGKSLCGYSLTVRLSVKNFKYFPLAHFMTSQNSNLKTLAVQNFMKD